MSPFGAREMVQSVKFLTHKHEDSSWTPTPEWRARPDGTQQQFQHWVEDTGGSLGPAGLVLGVPGPRVSTRWLASKGISLEVMLRPPYAYAPYLHITSHTLVHTNVAFYLWHKFYTVFIFLATFNKKKSKFIRYFVFTKNNNLMITLKILWSP